MKERKELLKEIRAGYQERGLTQEIIATRAGLRPTFVNRVLSGHHNSNYDTIHKIWSAVFEPVNNKQTVNNNTFPPDDLTDNTL